MLAAGSRKWITAPYTRRYVWNYWIHGNGWRWGLDPGPYMCHVCTVPRMHCVTENFKEKGINNINSSCVWRL